MRACASLTLTVTLTLTLTEAQAQFATIYDAQPLFSDSVLDLHGIKVNGTVLVDGRTAIRLASERARALAATQATAQCLQWEGLATCRLPGSKWTKCFACNGQGMPDCKACKGKGALEGDGWTQCFRCHGKGLVNDSNGTSRRLLRTWSFAGSQLGTLHPMRHKCGHIASAACSACHGKGAVIKGSSIVDCEPSDPQNKSVPLYAYACYDSDSDSDWPRHDSDSD